MRARSHGTHPSLQLHDRVGTFASVDYVYSHVHACMHCHSLVYSK